MDTTVETTEPEKTRKSVKLQVMVDEALNTELRAEIDAARAEGEELDVSSLARSLLRRWVRDRKAKRAPKP